MPTRQVNKMNNANKSVGGGIRDYIKSKFGLKKITVAPIVEPIVEPVVEPVVDLNEKDLVRILRERQIERAKKRKYNKVLLTGDDIDNLKVWYNKNPKGFEKFLDYEQQRKVTKDIKIENCSTIKNVIDTLLGMNVTDQEKLNKSIIELTWYREWSKDSNDNYIYTQPNTIFVYVKFDSDYNNCSLYNLAELEYNEWSFRESETGKSYRKYAIYDDEIAVDLTLDLRANHIDPNKFHSISGLVILKQVIIPDDEPREASSSRQSVRPPTSSSRVPSRLRPLPRRLTPLPPLQEQPVSGGKKSSKPVRKEILGKIRCVYKVPGSRKDHVKCKGKLITVKKYKELMKKAKTKKTKAKY
jgi:hypothetical protein